MKRNDCYKKTLVLGIIVLFIGLSITPSTGNIMFFDDTTPPVTTIYFNPEYPTGLNGWYVTPVTVTLVATDDMSGVNTTYYSINSEPWVIYEEPFVLTEDSLYHIVYFSVDNAGNIEFPKLVQIKLDQTEPFINLTYKVIYYDPIQGWEFIFTAIAVDHMSGMERVEFYVDDVLCETVIGSGPIYQWIKKYNFPFRVIGVTAYDQAGNMDWDEIKDPKIVARFISYFPVLRLILQPIINIMSRGMKYE